MPLTDGDHIRGLLGTYCQLIDAGDFAGIGQLMADAVLMTDDGTAIATGADEVAALYAGLVRLHDDGTPGTQHVVANTVLEELDGGAIRARSAYLVFQAVAGAPAAADHHRVLRRHLRPGHRTTERGASSSAGSASAGPATSPIT